MARALQLARRGIYTAHPNPRVGCVIVKNGKIIGEGYHAKYGEQHAEVVAFNNCSEPPEGADLYVNLEPCSIHGKTPPCTEKIIHSGIKNVGTNPTLWGARSNKIGLLL